MTYTMNFGDGTTGSVTQQGGCLSPPRGLAGRRWSMLGLCLPHLHQCRHYTATLLNASNVAFGTATITVGSVRPNVSFTAPHR